MSRYTRSYRPWVKGYWICVFNNMTRTKLLPIYTLTANFCILAPLQGHAIEAFSVLLQSFSNEAVVQLWSKSWVSLTYKKGSPSQALFRIFTQYHVPTAISQNNSWWPLSTISWRKKLYALFSKKILSLITHLSNFM